MAASFLNTASVVVLLSVLFAASRTEAKGASIDPLLLLACKTGGGGSSCFDVDFCLSAALGSDDGRSRGAGGYRELSAAAVAIDFVTANATSTAGGQDRRHALIRGGGGGNDYATTRCLRSSCRALYGSIIVVRRQPGCAAAAKAGEFDEPAKRSLEASASAACRECEDGFGVASPPPVKMEDYCAFKLVGHHQSNNAKHPQSVQASLPMDQ